MSIANSHIWRRLKRPLQKEQHCYFCGRTIERGMRDVWRYAVAYRSEYACPTLWLGACASCVMRCTKRRRWND